MQSYKTKHSAKPCFISLYAILCNTVKCNCIPLGCRNYNRLIDKYLFDNTIRDIYKYILGKYSFSNGIYSFTFVYRRISC